MVLDGMMGMGPVTKRRDRYTKARSVQISVDSVKLEGDLTIPKDAVGIVLFAHGSGSSRHSPRNIYVAQILQKAGLGTLLIDLLTEDEEKIDNSTGQLRFDIEFLANRLVIATRWLMKNPSTKELKIGYFGASTGAAAALVASIKCTNVKAIVSRGGRPDLAHSVLKSVKAPTLLIVGGNDFSVIEMNQKALNLLSAEKKLVVIPRATHLFEEPGTLQEVAHHAAHWFTRFLSETITDVIKS